MRRTKIVATIGPASDSPQVLDALIAAGMNVARLNASHSDLEHLDAQLRVVREAAARADRYVAVMLDLPGPKLRVGDMLPGTVLLDGSDFVLQARTCEGDAGHGCIPGHDLSTDVTRGDRILLDDGNLELVVSESRLGEVHTRVVHGGPLTSHKGVNVPGVTLDIDAITDTDRAALAWGLEAGIDLVAQSFVRCAADVLSLKHLIGDAPLDVIAKIEKHEAIADIDGIVEAVDGIMVARGDLGVETSPEDVPVLQRSIIRAARAQGKPVIVATQMLESMRTSPRPTRAEASDVATSIFQNADAVMLSAETAIGSYPVEAVRVADRIALKVEQSAGLAAPVQSSGGRGDISAAVSAAVADLARDLDLAAIVVATQSGATARAVARHRPGAPLIAVTPDERVARRLALVWGIRPLVVALDADTDVMLEAVLKAVSSAGLALPGSQVAITAGRASKVPGDTDFIQVCRIERP
ncbi:MAG: pyruvate kinase [Coriobacteriia bacterium]